MIAAVDGPARAVAIRTPTSRSAPPHLDDDAVRILLDDALNAALGDGEGNVHAFHGGEGLSGCHQPESIRRRPRKVSETHQTGAIPGAAPMAGRTAVAARLAASV